MGAGMNLTILRRADDDAASHALMTLLGTSNVTLCDFTLDGNNDACGVCNHVMKIGSSHDISLSRVEIKDGYSNGLIIGGGSWGIDISDCKFHGTRSGSNCHPLTIGNCRELQVDNCEFWDGDDYGFDCSMSENITFSNCLIHDCTRGAKITGTFADPAQGILLDNIDMWNLNSGESDGGGEDALHLEYVSHSAFNNIRIKGGYNGVTTNVYCRYLTFNNINLEKPAYVGFSCSGHDITMSNVYVMDAGSYGMYFTGHNVTVTNAQCKSCGHVRIENAENIKISNSIIKDCSSHGMCIIGSKHIDVSHTTITNCGSYGICLSVSTANKYYSISNCDINHCTNGVQTDADDTNFTISLNAFSDNTNAIVIGANTFDWIVMGNRCYGDPIDNNAGTGDRKVLANNIGSVI